MKKVLVIGSGGSGKSTFAARLGEATGLEVLHLDSFFWKPGWVETPKDEWRRKVAELAARESWIMDGNYGGTMEMRVEACDTVIMLDLPRRVCLWRVFKRVVKYRRGTRPDMAAGCDERFDLKFLRWVWDYRKKKRPGVLALLASHEQTKTIIRLRSPAEVEGFLANARRV